MWFLGPFTSLMIIRKRVSTPTFPITRQAGQIGPLKRRFSPPQKSLWLHHAGIPCVRLSSQFTFLVVFENCVFIVEFLVTCQACQIRSLGSRIIIVPLCVWLGVSRYFGYLRLEPIPRATIIHLPTQFLLYRLAAFFVL